MMLRRCHGGPGTMRGRRNEVQSERNVCRPRTAAAVTSRAVGDVESARGKALRGERPMTARWR